jgi:hypothetical protein
MNPREPGGYLMKKSSAQKTKASVPLKDWWSSVGEVGTRYW